MKPMSDVMRRAMLPPRSAANDNPDIGFGALFKGTSAVLFLGIVATFIIGAMS